MDGTVTDAAGQAADQGEPLDFGDIAYLQKHNMSLTVANTGQAPAKFSFMERPETGSEGSTSWLATSFKRRDTDDADATTDAGKEVVLEPGDTVTAFLEVTVSDTSLLRNLNAGKAKLEDILVLRVEDGRDHFIPVRATWLPSCFGRSIEELIRVPNGGIRAFLASKNQGAAPIPLDSEVHSAAPKELFKLTELVETLTTRVLADESMLDQRIVPADKQGWPFDSSSWLFCDKAAREAQVTALVEALDTDASLSEALPLDAPSIHRLEIAAEVLLLFLRTLTDGIVPVDIWAKTETALPNLASALAPARSPAEVEDDKAAVLDVLAATPNHNISFVFLTATLAKVAGDLSPVSRTDTEALTAAQGAKRFSRLARRMTAERQTAEAALARRRARERKFAEALGRVVCRAETTGVKDKERKATEDRMRVVVEMFVRKSLEDL
jgi:hypothetical protein